jgi:hypothetical protein
MKAQRKSVVAVSYVPISAFHGLAYRVSGLLRSMVSRGIDCELICPESITDSCQIREPFLVHRVNVKSSISDADSTFGRFLEILIFSIRAIPYLHRIKGSKMRVFQFEQIFLFPLAAFTRAVLRRKTIIDDFNLLHPDYDFLPKIILKLIDRLGVLVADSIITASPVSLEYVKGNFPNKTVHYVPNGVTPPQTAQSNQVPVTGVPRAIFIGGLGFHQNRVAIRNLVIIAKSLCKRNTPLVIEVVGGPLHFVQGYFETEVVKKGVIQFLGFLSSGELRAVCERAQIGLLPFFSDTPMVGGQRTKALEYLKYGLLIIAGPEGIGGLDELKPSQHYLLSSTPNQFALLLDRAAKQIGAFSSVREEGKNVVVNYYSWASVSKPLISEIYGT